MSAAECHFCHKQITPGPGTKGYREIVKRAIEKLGGQVDEQINKHTKYLIVGDRPSAAKIKKAQQMGIPIVCEDCLYDHIISPAIQQKTPDA